MIKPHLIPRWHPHRDQWVLEMYDHWTHATNVTHREFIAPVGASLGEALRMLQQLMRNAPARQFRPDWLNLQGKKL